MRLHLAVERKYVPHEFHANHRRAGNRQQRVEVRPEGSGSGRRALTVGRLRAPKLIIEDPRRIDDHEGRGEPKEFARGNHAQQG